jgi:hypothetical protein
MALRINNPRNIFISNDRYISSSSYVWLRVYQNAAHSAQVECAFYTNKEALFPPAPEQTFDENGNPNPLNSIPVQPPLGVSTTNITVTFDSSTYAIDVHNQVINYLKGLDAQLDVSIIDLV